MGDKKAEPFTFPCPSCRRVVAVARADRQAVRRAAKGEVFIVRVECPACKRVIVRSVVA